MVKKIEIKVDNNGSEFVCMCSNCNAIREYTGEDTSMKEQKWFHLEDDPVAYIKFIEPFLISHRISHGNCYACVKKLYPEFYPD